MAEETIFELTENHIKLLRRMYVDWDDSAYDGAPTIALKRPYGNSAVATDVAEIIGEPIEAGEHLEEGEMGEEQRERLLALHRETATALQIVLISGAFEPGVYTRPNTYQAHAWRRITDG